MKPSLPHPTRPHATAGALTLVLLACFLADALLAAEPVPPAGGNTIGGRIVVGYAVAHPSKRGVFTDPAMRDFIMERVTHVVLLGAYSFDEEGGITVDEECLGQAVAATHAKGRKISATFGGPHAEVFATAKSRERLIAGVLDACRKHRLDGADFDYEYPRSMKEREDFETFLNGLRAAAPEGLLLSVAVSTWGPAPHFVPASAVPALDWVFLMAYGKVPERMTYDRTVREAGHCLSLGVPADKLVLGMPLYACNGTSGPGYRGLIGDDTRLARTVDEHKKWHFNGPATIERKTRFAVEKDLAGIGWWYVGLDFQDDRSLMEAAVSVLRDSAAQAAE